MNLSAHVIAIAAEIHTEANKNGTPITFELALQVAAQVQQTQTLQSELENIAQHLEVIANKD